MLCHFRTGRAARRERRPGIDPLTVLVRPKFWPDSFHGDLLSGYGPAAEVQATTMLRVVMKVGVGSNVHYGTNPGGTASAEPISRRSNRQNSRYRVSR